MIEQLAPRTELGESLIQWAGLLILEDAIVGDRVTPEQLFKLDDFGRFITLIDDSGNILAGACIFPTQNEDIQEIGAICVAPEYRGKGLLSQIVTQVIQVAESNSWTTIVVTDNKSVTNAFSKSGFREEDPKLILSLVYPQDTDSDELNRYNDSLIAERKERIAHKDAVVLTDPILSGAIDTLS